MPKLEPKKIQKELEQGILWPVYWIYGQERLKIRELLKRIRSAVLSKGDGPDGLAGLQETSFDGAETSIYQIRDEAESFSLMGKARLIVVRDAHLLKNSENLADLLGPARPLQELLSICVFISKDLDARKKFSKVLLENAAVVPCEEVPEHQREAWILYLAKRQDLTLSQGSILKLSFLDPWSLDGVNQELEKMSLAQISGERGGAELEWVRGNPSPTSPSISGQITNGGADLFLDSFFQRKLGSALPWASYLADRPDEALPLLGLLAWNVKHLALWIVDGNSNSPTSRLSPFILERLKKWSPYWTLSEVLALQRELSLMDYSIKQTSALGVGIWTKFILSMRTRSHAAVSE